MNIFAKLYVPASAAHSLQIREQRLQNLFGQALRQGGVENADVTIAVIATQSLNKATIELGVESIRIFSTDKVIEAVRKDWDNMISSIWAEPNLDTKICLTYTVFA